MIPIHPKFQLHGKTITDPKMLLKYVKENFPSHILFLEELFHHNDKLLVKTSGSTGKPKNIWLNKKSILNSAQMTIEYFQLLPGTKALLNLSTDYIAGKMMWVRALTGGWNLYLSTPKNSEIKKWLKKEKFDFGAMVPIQLIENIDLIDNIDLLIIGGGALNKKFLPELYSKSTAVYATYGMTETVTHIAVKPLNPEAQKRRDNLKEGCFTALPQVSFQKDHRNCLIIGAPHLHDEKIITNDMVELLDQTHFIWKGRFDNVINSGGIKIIPEEIEKILEPYIDSSFFISSQKEKKLGEKIILIMEGVKEKNIDFDRILPKYSIPKAIYYLPRFIRTETGKIDRTKTLDLIREKE